MEDIAAEIVQTVIHTFSVDFTLWMIQIFTQNRLENQRFGRNKFGQAIYQHICV